MPLYVLKSLKKFINLQEKMKYKQLMRLMQEKGNGVLAGMKRVDIMNAQRVVEKCMGSRE